MLLSLILAHVQIACISESDVTDAAFSETSNKLVMLIKRMAAAVACAEALPGDALRRAHPRKRWLADARLDQPELIIGCWASG